MSILIVDDTANSRIVLKAHLKAAGYDDVLTAASAAEAFEYLGMDAAAPSEPVIDLILMDIMMPEIDGIEACRRIKAVERVQDIPIIVVTGHEEVEYLDQALAAGAMDYMTKPVNKVELRARVRSALALKQEIDRRKHAYSDLEKQFLQAQKMESVGRLAATLAHDFRNMLTPIIGYSQMGMAGLSPKDSMYSKLEEILKSADRAANLTSRMLAWMRTENIKPRVLDLNHVIVDMNKLLRRLIGEDVELVTVLCREPWNVAADSILIEQALMNLVVNARDAMPNGGTLTIETNKVTIEKGYLYEGREVPPGDYVTITVRDTGIGIPEDVRVHIFEPFFTTKEVSKGTGLGLATCSTIVARSGGHIEVHSKPGEGAIFMIFLPRCQKSEVAGSRGAEAVPLPRGEETILLAEDEPAVRDLVANILLNQGYTVLDASNGREALRVAQKHAGQNIDLLLTDVVMPQIGGAELASRLRVIRPNIKVLLTSGYVDDEARLSRMLGYGAAFIEKPFLPATLACKVRELLDE